MFSPKSVLYDNLGDFHWIYHLSDIHIRVLERHEEYYYIFNSCLDIIKNKIKINEGRPIICITGDVFDNQRLEMKPETVQLARFFIEELAKITYVIIIPGNHDLIEGNQKRLDQITPIITYCNRVIYLKESGIYIVNNISFIVSSLYDAKFINKSNCIIPSNTTPIYLYHGYIGSIFNNSSSTTSRARRIADFEGFPKVLLGDIHEWGPIRYSIQSTGSMTQHMQYAGSLIQQNFGEKICHGFLLWNVNGDEGPQKVWIPNPYSFIIVKFIDGRITTTYDVFMAEGQKFPEKARIRIDSDLKSELKYMSEKPVKEYLEKLGWKGSICDIKHKEQIVVTTNISPEISNNCIIPSENEAILEILKKEDKLYHEDLYNLHISISKKCNIDDSIQIHNKWRPINLKWYGLASYRGTKEHSIDFIGGVSHISGHNASGKSSIKNILIYSIYGQINDIEDHTIINKYSEKGHSEITISLHNGFKLIITRDITNKKGKYTSDVSLRSEGFIINISESRTKFYKEEVDKKISEILGNPSTFINNSMNLRTMSWNSTMSKNEELR
ncbi:MAG: hypothetical protein EBQ92_00195, partial [Proteobacteria bacterium]|nr:hypothetical protein [Pseudomonadota bacterium]